MSIKVALVGLSAHAATGWASVAHLPYLLSERGRARFTIVALLNSSEDAARSAIAHFKLPDSTAAYGDADKLAADIVGGKIDVNLLVVSTRVDVHYPAALPLLKAVAKAKTTKSENLGVLVEWPLGKDLAEIRELAALAADNRAHLRTAVAAQGRLSPIFLAVRDLIASGRLGRILSSEARIFSTGLWSGGVTENLAYIYDRSFGGTLITIALGHIIDPIQSAIGELTDFHSETQLQKRSVSVVRRGDDGEEVVVKTINPDVPDLITVVGKLAPVTNPDVPAAATSSFFSDGSATLLVRLRGGQPFPDEPAFAWSIAGEKGELRLVSHSTPFLQAFAGGEDTAVTLSLHDYASGTVTEVPWHWSDWQTQAATLPSRTIGALYEAYADGREAAYLTFADALARSEQLDAFLDGFSG